MRSLTAVSLTLMILFIGFVAGCNKGTNPINPDEPDQSSTSFYAYSQIFPETGNDVFRDTDLATLALAGEATYALNGSPAIIEYDNDEVGFCIQVSLEHDSATNKIPWLAWMIGDDSGSSSIVDRRDFAWASGDIGDGYVFKYPKVSAIYYQGAQPASSKAVVAVSGMARPDDGSEWGIGIYFMQWSGSYFESGTMGDPDYTDAVYYQPDYNAANQRERIDIESHDETVAKSSRNT